MNRVGIKYYVFIFAHIIKKYNSILTEKVIVVYERSVNPLKGSQLLFAQEVALPRSRATQSLGVYLGHLSSGVHKNIDLTRQG